MKTSKHICYLFIVFFFSCVSEGSKSLEVQTNTKVKDSAISLENIEKVNNIKHIFYSLPSPIELTYLFKQEGVEYQRDKLLSTKEKDKYILPRDKALILGIYGADLSYAGLFGKHQDAIEYFATVKIMAEEIGVGETFQKEFISRLEKNADNKDTLLQVISEFFIENDNYLKDYNRQDISAHILLGGWLEGIYLGTEMTLNYNALGIKRILADQKTSLDNLILLFEKFQSTSEQSEELFAALKDLLPLFKELNLTSESNDPNLLMLKEKVEAMRKMIVE